MSSPDIFGSLLWGVISVLVLGVLIFVHELGHFLLAKWNKVGVIEFAIGFGKRIWQKKIGVTIYSVRLIPLGGFVKMVGDDPQQVWGGARSAADNGDNQAASPPEEIDAQLLQDRSCWFLEKGVLAKLSIVLAGPGFNILFAVILSILTVLIYGKDEPLTTAQIGSLIPGLPAEQGGLLAGDQVVRIGDSPVATWEEMSAKINTSEGRELVFHVERMIDGVSRQVQLPLKPIPPSAELELQSSSDVPRSFMIGVNPATLKVSVGPLEACSIGAFHTLRISQLIVESLVKMLSGSVSAKNIGGPILILKEAGKHAKAGAEQLFGFMIFLSISLAILNLLPIPVLDGGHLVFFLIEGIKGTPVSLRLQEHANQVGLVILLALMVFALGNDITNLF